MSTVTNSHVVALDYDGTASLDVIAWRRICTTLRDRGFDVMIVTMRMAHHLDEVERDFGEYVSRIIHTSHRAKLPFVRALGINPSIWIDDCPHFVYLNVDGTIPEEPNSLKSMLIPDFAESIAQQVNHVPLKIHGYGFFFTDCHHEVPFLLQSFHRTKLGAYRAMRKFLLDEWEKHMKHYREDTRYFSYRDKDGKRMRCGKRDGKWYGPFFAAKWTVRKHVMEIQP